MTLIIAAWTGVVWSVLSVIIFVVSILTIGVILIQDSKDSGLGSAFGGAGGGSALLGARMQKDLAKVTAFFGGILAVCLVVVGLLDNRVGESSQGGAGAPPPAAVTESLPDAGASAGAGAPVAEGDSVTGAGSSANPVTPPEGATPAEPAPK